MRLIYHEQMRAADETERCVLKVGELRERLALAGRSSSSIQRRALSDALKRLQRHALVALDRGFQGEDAESMTVSPLIAKVLAPDKVAELARRVRAYASPSAEAGDDPAGEDEGGGDPP